MTSRAALLTCLLLLVPAVARAELLQGELRREGDTFFLLGTRAGRVELAVADNYLWFRLVDLDGKFARVSGARSGARLEVDGVGDYHDVVAYARAIPGDPTHVACMGTRMELAGFPSLRRLVVDEAPAGALVRAAFDGDDLGRLIVRAVRGTVRARCYVWGPNDSRATRTLDAGTPVWVTLADDTYAYLGPDKVGLDDVLLEDRRRERELVIEGVESVAPPRVRVGGRVLPLVGRDAGLLDLLADRPGAAGPRIARGVLLPDDVAPTALRLTAVGMRAADATPWYASRVALFVRRDERGVVAAGERVWVEELLHVGAVRIPVGRIGPGRFVRLAGLERAPVAPAPPPPPPAAVVERRGGLVDALPGGPR